MTDMQSVFQVVKALTPEELDWLEAYIAELRQQVPQSQEQARVFDLHPGAFWTSDDFDAPLPDEFWLGEA